MRKSQLAWNGTLIRSDTGLFSFCAISASLSSARAGVASKALARRAGRMCFIFEFLDLIEVEALFTSFRRLRLGKFPSAIEDFLARTIEANHVVPALHDWQAVRRAPVAASESDDK